MPRAVPTKAGRYVRARLDPDEYDWFQRAAKKRGATVPKAARLALRSWALDELGEPWMKIVGIIDGPEDAAADIDDIYLED